MNTNIFKNNILEGKFDKSFSQYYGNTEYQKERYAQAIDGFTAEYGADRDIRIF